MEARRFSMIIMLHAHGPVWPRSQIAGGEAGMKARMRNTPDAAILSHMVSEVE